MTVLLNAHAETRTFKEPRTFKLREDVALRIVAWGYFFVFLKLHANISAQYGDAAANVFAIATASLLVAVAWPALFSASVAEFNSRLNERLTIAGMIIYVPAISLGVTALCICFGLV